MWQHTGTMATYRAMWQHTCTMVCIVVIMELSKSVARQPSFFQFGAMAIFLNPALIKKI